MVLYEVLFAGLVFAAVAFVSGATSSDSACASDSGADPSVRVVIGALFVMVAISAALFSPPIDVNNLSRRYTAKPAPGLQPPCDRTNTWRCLDMTMSGLTSGFCRDDDDGDVPDDVVWDRSKPAPTARGLLHAQGRPRRLQRQPHRPCRPLARRQQRV